MKKGKTPLHERTPLTGVFSKVNSNNLDKEAIRQLELMEEYGELSAEAVYEVERLEEKKKTIRSGILLANQNKAKNAQIAEAMYRVDPTYLAVCKKLCDAIYRRELLQNAMFSLSHRRDTIDLLSRRQIATLNIDSIKKGVRK